MDGRCRASTIARRTSGCRADPLSSTSRRHESWPSSTRKITATPCSTTDPPTLGGSTPRATAALPRESSRKPQHVGPQHAEPPPPSPSPPQPPPKAADGGAAGAAQAGRCFPAGSSGPPSRRAQRPVRARARWLPRRPVLSMHVPLDAQCLLGFAQRWKRSKRASVSVSLSSRSGGSDSYGGAPGGHPRP